MTAAVRIGVGTRFRYDGETVTVIELVIAQAGNEVVLHNATGKLVVRIALRELLNSERAQLIPDAAESVADVHAEPATIVLAELTERDLDQMRERAAHVREVLTGYCAGTAELAAEGEPRPEYASTVLAMRRYEAKAAELGVGVRTIKRMGLGLPPGRRSWPGPKTRPKRWWVADEDGPSLGRDSARGDGRAHRGVDAVADDGDRPDERPCARAVRRGCGEGTEPGDGVPGAGGTGASASDVPVKRQAESGHRGPAGRGVREAAANETG